MAKANELFRITRISRAGAVTRGPAIQQRLRRLRGRAQKGGKGRKEETAGVNSPSRRARRVRDAVRNRADWRGMKGM